MADVRTILDCARSAIPGSIFLLNGKLYGLALWERLLDLAWLGKQAHDSRVACIHCSLMNESIIAPDYLLGFHIVDSNLDNTFNSPLIGRVRLMQLPHLGYETLNQGLSCQVSDNVLGPFHVRSETCAELHAVLKDGAPTRLRPNAPHKIYFNSIISYLRLTTCKTRQLASRKRGCFACAFVLLDRYADDWAEA